MCYNSLPCGAECYLRRPQGIQPTSKKNRRLVLTKHKHKVWAKYVSESSSSEESQSSVQVKKFFKPKRAPSDQDKQLTDPDPVFIGR